MPKNRRDLEIRRRAVGLLLSAFILPVASRSSGPPAPLYKKKYAMGTVFEIVTYGVPLPRASVAIDHALDEIVRLDHVMSNYKSDSDLSRLNRSAHFHAVAVPDDLYRVVQESIEYSRLSEGEFDITVGPLVDRWKAAIRGKPLPTAADEERLRRCIGYRKIELVPPNRIEFRSPCLQLDLGAIGKGYAVDRARAILRSYGVSNALINAGGSTIYGMGAPPGLSAWRVRLRDPSARLDPYVMLRGSSVSTSEQTPPSLLGTGRFGHILDPATGLPLKTAFAVSVVAQTATASDGLSTTLLLLGPEKGKALVRKLPGIAAVWISPTGETETASTGPRIVIDRAGAAH